nr:hypothetical protein GCM10010200_043530 [Actinomadura rugatobispora]
MGGLWTGYGGSRHSELPGQCGVRGRSGVDADRSNQGDQEFLSRARLGIGDNDVFEVNEAFASTSLD